MPNRTERREPTSLSVDAADHAEEIRRESIRAESLYEIPTTDQMDERILRRFSVPILHNLWKSNWF
jgi:hypothetical protein